MTEPAMSPLSFQILLALVDRDRYGYDIIEEIERQTDGAMSPKTGSLYAALQRLQDEGHIAPAADAPDPDEDSRRRYYCLTPKGRRALREQTLRLARFVRLANRKRLFPDPSPPPLTQDA